MVCVSACSDWLRPDLFQSDDVQDRFSDWQKIIQVTVTEHYWLINEEVKKLNESVATLDCWGLVVNTPAV